MSANPADTWHPTACILCTLNCGIQVQLDEANRITKVRGDENHPASRGYVCNKASRLGYYQNAGDRVLSPLKRTPEGGYQPVSWETALAEISDKLAQVRDSYGGESIFYYGGGAQGNHSSMAYSRALHAALGIKYRSNAIAQEKTGEFWVTEQMFGGWNHADFDHAQVAVFLGKNPWQAHGIQRARIVCREIARDPERTLIVIDPKRTETADLADIHLAPKPATDAWLLAAMIATIIQENLLNRAWLELHAQGVAEVIETFADVDVSAYAAKCGVAEADIRATARVIAAADSVGVMEDLGVQMNRHSTLVSYLQRLVWLLCGHFGRRGTHFTTNGVAIMGSGEESGVTPVLGEKLISGLVPSNVVAAETLADHPARYRAMIIDSSNPVHSLADSPQWREAMRALECSVVIEVAMTETAREADYVLPARNQFEKAEMTFFNFEFPQNFFHVRQPVCTAPDGPKEEGEIYALLMEALGAMPSDIVDDLNEALAKGGRAAFTARVFDLLGTRPELMAIAPAVLYRTLGRTLPEGMQNAAGLWVLCQQYALSRPEAIEKVGLESQDATLGDALFDHLLASPSGCVVSEEEWDAVWARLPGGTVSLAIDELLADAVELKTIDPTVTSEQFPFVLSAGERRAYTANHVLRNPLWRRKDAEGALHINPEDAARLNLGDGSLALVSTPRGQQHAVVELNDRMQSGHIALPNGQGMDYQDIQADSVKTGASVNELTSWESKDQYAGTPWHKSVPARLEAADSADTI